MNFAGCVCVCVGGGGGGDRGGDVGGKLTHSSFAADDRKCT